MKAKVYVTLKGAVLDPQGKAVKQSLVSLGYREVDDVRVGKYIVLNLGEGERGKAKARVEEMCKKLLANTVIEEYRYELE
jgi:phosphoribosylformylglycinamidine synthase subunit PurS